MASGVCASSVGIGQGRFFMSKRARSGVLLVNLGTPQAPTAAAVRPYLRQFLMDGRVINIPAPMRWLLVNGIIAPLRAPKSAKAYASIWTDEGSPLLVHSQHLQKKVQKLLDSSDMGEPVPVVLAMRYGEPSIAHGVQELREKYHVEHIVVVPLYPQYSSATTGTVVEEVLRVMKDLWAMPSMSVVPPFYQEAGFINSFAMIAEQCIKKNPVDHVLLSYHGLPEDHVKKCDPSGQHCLKKANCCDEESDNNVFCYRHQCTVTSKKIAQALGLSADQWSMSFQSRLGQNEWLKPYTEPTVKELAKKYKRIAVLCPAFVADCLETLEEIGERARHDFKEAGGEELFLIPSLNSDDQWAETIALLAKRDLKTRRGLLPVVNAPSIINP